MSNNRKYSTSTKRDLSTTRWRLLGALLALLALALLIIVTVAILVALGLIAT